MSTYQAQFFSKLQGNIRDLESKLTADEKGNLTHALVNTSYWAKALQQTFSDMNDVGMMIAMGASCDFSLVNEKAKELTAKHDKELKEGIDTVAQMIIDSNK